jgi:anti-anti-sigma factor
MAITSFEAHIRHQPRAAIIDLKGEINTLAEHTLISAFEDAANQHPELILLNFQRVEYINSTGIALIVEVLKRARKINCPLLASGLSDHYLEIFRISRLTDYITVFPDEASALQGNHASR